MTSITSSHNTPDTEPTDEEIRNTLIKENIITNERVLKCGHWTHYKSIGKERVRRPQQFFCERYICRVCRRKILDTNAVKQYKQNLMHTENGGEILLITFTIPHRHTHTLSYLYPRFRTALSQMKKHDVWRDKLKKETNYSYHYDNIEITHSVENGFHPHNHITFCCNPFKTLTLEKIKDYLNNIWRRRVDKNELHTPSKEYGVHTTRTHMGSHSNHYGTKSLDILTKKNGTLERYEKEIHLSSLQPNHKFPDNMDRDEMKDTIKQLLQTFSKMRKFRIHYK